MRWARLEGRRIISDSTSEVVAVTDGKGRGIIGEAQGVVLVLSWWKEYGLVGQGILENKGVGCTSGLLGESTMMEARIHPSAVRFEQHVGVSSTKLRLCITDSALT